MSSLSVLGQQGIAYWVLNADVRALLLTVDSAVGDLRQAASKFNGVKGDASPGARMDPITQVPPYHDPTMDWNEHIDDLKALAGDLPIYLKGVCHIDVSLLLSPDLDRWLKCRMSGSRTSMAWRESFYQTT